MHKRALIIGTYEPWIDLYKAAFANAGIAVDIADPTKFVITVQHGLSLQSPDSAFAEQYDYIIPLEEDFEHLYYSFAIDEKYGQAAMLNKDSILSHPNFSNKFYQYQLIDRYSSLAVPTTRFSVNPGLLSGYVEPDRTIAKILQSARGRGVFKLSSREELIQLYDEYGKRMLIQEYFESQPAQDYRTLLVGGQSLGTIKRTASHGFTTNGASQIEVVQDAPYVREFSELVQALNLDYCGIDYVLVDDQPVILEINRFAYMGAWKNVVGPDVTAAVVKLLQAE